MATAQSRVIGGDYDLHGFLSLGDQLKELESRDARVDVLLRLPLGCLDVEEMLPDMKNQGPERFWSLYVHHYGPATQEYCWSVLAKAPNVDMPILASAIVPPFDRWERYDGHRVRLYSPGVWAVEIEFVHFVGGSVEHARALLHDGDVLAVNEVALAFGLQDHAQNVKKFRNRNIVIAGLNVRAYDMGGYPRRFLVPQIRYGHARAEVTGRWSHRGSSADEFWLPVIRNQKQLSMLP